MSGDFPFPATKTVSPVKCNEKPWDLWISEIGYRSPRREDEPKGERGRRRRPGLNRLRHDSMSLHGLLPQSDTLDAAVCHMCGVVVKCSAAYRHLLEQHSAHSALEPLPPPPPPAVKPKAAPARARPRRDPPPAPPDPPAPTPPAPAAPPALAVPPAVPAMPPLPSLPALPALPVAPPDLHYLQDAAADVQVSVDTGDLPVVSIQDPEDLPLGENITDDIIAIMNSEGIRREDDIAGAPDWKNIIRDLDIGNMQDFTGVGDPAPAADPYGAVDPPMTGYAPPDELALQFAAASPAPPPLALDAPTAKPATPSSRAARKPAKTKFNLREYDPNKHCGVCTAENPKPCTRSLTCKAHALSLRRAVDGRAKPFDTLLAEHRAARDAAHQPPPLASAAPAAAAAPAGLDLIALNGLADDERVDDIYKSLLADEDPDSALPDTSGITSLLSQPLPPPPHLQAQPLTSLPPQAIRPPPPSQPPAPPPALEPDGEAEAAEAVCRYASSPRPLALCTFNASQAGGAVMLGKKFATVRGNLKASLARGGKAAAAAGGAACAASRATRQPRPELRRLLAACRPAAGLGGGAGAVQALSELFGGEARLNGHAPQKGRLKAGKRPAAVLDLGFSLDPLLADEKC